VTTAAAPGFRHRLALFSGEIKVQESVFALPFAYTGMVLAADGAPTWGQFAWITLAMVSARTLGMSANRIVDKHIDSRNPRTSGRNLASGRLRTPEMVALAAIAVTVFFIAAALLNTLALALAPLAAAYLVIYPFAKRYTWAASFLLGWALAIAPSAAWIGVRGSLGWEPVLLSTSVALWAASFDILYHAQDFDFYTDSGLHSMARRFGVHNAFRIARGLDALAIACLVGVGAGLGLAWPYYIGCAVAAAVLVYKHSMVSPGDLSRMGVAFFRINAYVSLSVFIATLIAVLAA
jgi:4-hydroxybenzoate polyprenyltransferase